MSTKKRKPKPPAPIAVETVFDVHMTITVRGAGRDHELAVEELVTALFDERGDEARSVDGLELTIVDAVGFDVRHVCDAKSEGQFFDKDGDDVVVACGSHVGMVLTTDEEAKS